MDSQPAEVLPGNRGRLVATTPMLAKVRGQPYPTARSALTPIGSRSAAKRHPRICPRVAGRPESSLAHRGLCPPPTSTSRKSQGQSYRRPNLDFFRNRRVESKHREIVNRTQPAHPPTRSRGRRGQVPQRARGSSAMNCSAADCISAGPYPDLRSASDPRRTVSTSSASRSGSASGSRSPSRCASATTSASNP